MLTSIDEVWVPYVEKCQGDFLLLLDQFTAHVTKAVLDKFASLRTFIIFIPAGYTGKLQILDVGLNRPFKVYIRNCFDGFMVEHVDDPSSIIPKRQDVAGWG